MALPPGENTAILREVDDAVRADVARDVAMRHGRTIAAVALAGLLAFGGWTYWNHRQETRAMAEGKAFNAALEKAGGDRNALNTALSPLAKDGTPAYRALAGITRGSSAATSGDAAGASRAFAAVANDQSLPEDLRDVARVRQAVADMDRVEPGAIVTLLAPIVSGDRPAWGAAAELTAVAELKRGNRAAATALYRRIAASPNASEALKTRANQMAGSLAATVSTSASTTATSTAASTAPAATRAPAPSSDRTK